MEKKRRFFQRIIIAVLLLGVFALGWFFGGGHSHQQTACEHTAEQHQGETVWTCSMHPQIRLPEPGKCPICFMDLIPASKDEDTASAVSLRQVRMSAEARKLAEVQVFPVQRKPVKMEIPMFGRIDYDETRLGYLTAWTAGRIDRLHVNYTGSTVRKGDPVASIYSPELITAQAELIQAVRAAGELDRTGLKRVRDAAGHTESAAREKLRLLGLSADQINQVLETGAPSEHMTLHAPTGGVVIERNVVEGMYVQTGTRIFTIADLSRVWVVLEAYESDLQWIRPGMAVQFQTEAYPGEIFTGKTVFIDPVVSERTRTVRVRLEAANRDGELKPGMFVRAWKQAVAAENPLVIPASAPLVTGKRAIVYVQVPGEESIYEGREILLGARAGDYYIVRQGLSEGEMVVARGAFKIDSAAQLMARPSMMSPFTYDRTDATDSEHELLIPPQLASGLSELAKAFEAVKSAVEKGGLAESRKAFMSFHGILGDIDGSSLEDRPALVWKEAAMLLFNDSMLGVEADTDWEARSLFETMAGHFAIITDHFPVDRILQAKALLDSVPAGFKRDLGGLLKKYFVLQQALADDDLQRSGAAAESFREALPGIDMSMLEGDAHRIWMKAKAGLRKGTAGITPWADIEEIRVTFEYLSIGMTLAVEKLGVEIDGPVFELYCPMAFDWRGAAWLQPDDDLFNPYFGAMMLKCGEVRRQLKSE